MYTEATFEILEHISVLSSNETGWSKEANIVAWNGGVPKLDIREWNSTHERMSRGITLFEEDAFKLVETLKENLPSATDFPTKAPEDTSESAKVSFNIMKHLGVLSEREVSDGTWTKEVNIVSRNGGKPKVDIRDWEKATHERMTRGIALTRDEAVKLSEIELEHTNFLKAKINDRICLSWEDVLGLAGEQLDDSENADMPEDIRQEFEKLYNIAYAKLTTMKRDIT